MQIYNKPMEYEKQNNNTKEFTLLNYYGKLV